MRLHCAPLWHYSSRSRRARSFASGWRQSTGHQHDGSSTPARKAVANAPPFQLRLATTELRIAGAAATGGAFVLVTEIDPSFGQVVDRQFERHAVARENTDVILAHASGRISANHDAVVERHAVTAIRKYFVDDTVKFKQFFFRHALLLVD